MSSETATKLVAMFAFGGTAFMLFFAPDAQTRYRRVWGITLLSIAGAALADIAPQIVGAYFGLIILAFAVANSNKLGEAVKGIEIQAGVRKK